MTTIGPVNWETIQAKIVCPLCDYNLRGLIEPRCPECGSRYEWEDLLDRRRQKHPYLFEHHPNRNLRSFWQTMKGGLRPRRFWRSLHPVQPRSLPRLLLYVFMLILLFHVGQVISTFEIHVYSLLNDMVTKCSSMKIPFYCFKFMDVASGAWHDFLTNPFILNYETVAIILAWPLVTFLALLVFQISMRRAKVKNGHVLRCVVYSSDIIVWYVVATVIIKLVGTAYYFVAANFLPFQANLSLFIAWLVLVTVNDLARHFSGNLRKSKHPRKFFLITRVLVWGGILILFRNLAPLPNISIEAPLLVICFIMGVHRLIVAFRHYLQFDRPFMTIIASQIVVALIMLNIYMPLMLW